MARTRVQARPMRKTPQSDAAYQAVLSSPEVIRALEALADDVERAAKQELRGSGRTNIESETEDQSRRDRAVVSLKLTDRDSNGLRFVEAERGYIAKALRSLQSRGGGSR